MNNIKQSVGNFFLDIRQSIQNDYAANIMAQRDVEREDNIAIATIAMIDAGITDDVISNMLVKHWDLRPSETASFISWAHNHFAA